MKKMLVPTLLATSAFLLSCANTNFQPPPEKDMSLKTPVKKEAPEKERDKLEIPEAILREAQRNVGFEDKVLGFTANEIDRYSGSEFRLRAVPRLFSDVSKLPRYSGGVSDFFLREPGDFANDVGFGFSLLSASGGRGVTPPKEGWGVDWIPARTDVQSGGTENAGLDEAFEAILEHARKNGIENPANEDDIKSWHLLPDEIKKLAVKLVIASFEAGKVIRQSFDEEFLLKSTGVTKTEELTAALLYELGSAPWTGEDEITPRESFEAMERFDIKYLCYGSIAYFKYAQAALKEFQEWKKTNSFEVSDFKKCVFETAAGKVCITGIGADEISGDYSLVIDMGGDDIYTGRTAIPRSLAQSISVVVDIGGNDKYDSGGESAGFACGNHGIGAIFDLEGNDIYACADSGIASTWYGTGLVVDYSGSDSYSSKGGYSLGCGFFGVGILIDLAGDDAYNGVKYSQGFGGTYGVGLLLDISGNDTYKSEGELAPSVWGKNPVSMSMGVACGRRADYGDGHSLAGGIGLLIDGAGDDSYQSFVFSLGTGYWWGTGIFEDCAGNDTYSATYYSFGAGAHFALGCMVDRAGDDNYCPDIERVTASFGEGRDGSIGVFFEAEGNDKYHGIGYRSAGNSDLNSIGLFWDRCGDDTYETINKFDNKSQYSMIFGSASKDPPDKDPTEPIPNIGIFLDTGGIDTYTTAKEDMPHKAMENNSWRHNEGPIYWSFGLDIDWFLPALEDKK